jgi:C1A family cysteine protease
MFHHAFVEKTADIANLIAALDAGQPAILGVRITLQFYTPPADYIIRTVANDPIVANHAMVAVGRGTDGSDTLVLVRNSWGETWADLGYAWLTADYLKRRILRIAVPSM